MDRPAAPGQRHRRAAAHLLSTDGLGGVCLDRTLSLEGVTVQIRDWPGVDGPLVHVPDPLHVSTTVEVLATGLTPRYRVLSISPRIDCPYQVHVADLHGVFAQLGFEHAVVAAEGLGCVTALFLGAWFPGRIGALALIDPRFDAPAGQTLLARSLRDCPIVRPHVDSRVLEVAGTSPTLVDVIEQLLGNHPVP